MLLLLIQEMGARACPGVRIFSVFLFFVTRAASLLQDAMQESSRPLGSAGAGSRRIIGMSSRGGGRRRPGSEREASGDVASRTF